MLLLFFFLHTLVKHGHRAPDYRLQNHIHTVLSKETHRDGCSRGSRGGPLWLRGCSPSLFPQAGRICFFLLLFFFGKSNFVKPQKSDARPNASELFPLAWMHERHVTFWGRRANLNLPLTFQSPKHKQTWEVTSLASFCLVLNMNTYFDMFAQRCVCVQKRSAYVWHVCGCIQSWGVGGRGHRINGTERRLLPLIEQASIH